MDEVTLAEEIECAGDLLDKVADNNLIQTECGIRILVEDVGGFGQLG